MYDQYKRRLIETVAFTVFSILFFIPLVSKCQLHGKYFIRVTLINGERIKSSEVKLLDSAGRVVLKKYCDTFGQCKFTGVNKGIYRVVNKLYRVDTTFSIPDTSMLSVLPKLTTFDVLVDLDICNLNAELARKEIKKGYVRLLLIGSIAPVYYYGQEKFEKKFAVNYYDFGCTPPSLSCVTNYNQVVFQYLDKKYGKTWRKEVRDDVIGYHKYIATHKLD